MRLSRPGGALFRVTAAQPGAWGPRSELRLVTARGTDGRFSLEVDLLDGGQSELVHARWGGLSLRTVRGWAVVRAWTRVVARWDLRGGPLRFDVSGRSGWFSSPRFRKRVRCGCPWRPSHSVGLLWPEPDAGEATRQARLTRWERDGADLLALPVSSRSGETRWRRGWPGSW